MYYTLFSHRLSPRRWLTKGKKEDRAKKMHKKYKAKTKIDTSDWF